MDGLIFISRGKRFQWKARALPVLIDKLEKCKKCNGEGFKPMYGNEPEQCYDCNGTGHELWTGPYDLELETFLQTKIDEYYSVKHTMKELFHDD